jgi:hypothetical protein
MSKPSHNHEDDLRDLAEAINSLERRTTPPPLPAKRKRLGNPERDLNPEFAIWLLAWVFRLFWLVWIIFALVVTPPRQISDWIVVPFSGVVCWLIFQFHKAIVVAVAQRKSRTD